MIVRKTMALTNAKKNELISQLESALEDAQAGAGVTSSLSEIETAVGALRTAYDADPATVDAQDLVDARAMIEGCQFGSLTSSSNEWAEAQNEAAA
jgi:hypothetical protein